MVSVGGNTFDAVASEQGLHPPFLPPLQRRLSCFLADGDAIAESDQTIRFGEFPHDFLPLAIGQYPEQHALFISEFLGNV